MTDVSLTTADMDWLCNEVLTLIEIHESRLLNWGFVDVKSNLSAEISQILESLPDSARARWEAAQRAGFIPQDILSNLMERKLLFRRQGLYRSRFAESIRLLYL